jgi:cation:H+ antiporter
MVAGALFLLGLGLLVGGGELLVRGAVALADRLGIPPVVVGMTVVAFGTSAPELVVSLSAAVQGEGAIAFGNVVGSNIANLGLLLGVVALVRPLVVHPSIVVREIPMLILGSVAAVALSADRVLAGAPGDALARGDGIVLLLLFGVFLYYTLADALKKRSADPFLAEAAETAAGKRPGSAGTAAVQLLAGLALLVVGGQTTVAGATGLARALGLPEAVIGLTMVAVGTSLPELATSIIAARRNQTDLAVGNLVGSNLFNLLFILGLSATAAPSAVPPGGTLDLLVAAGFAVVLLPLAITHQRRVTRLEGACLLVAYVACVGWIALR